MTELRGEYLFALGNVCGISPNEPLKLRDFFQLITDIDAYIEAKKQSGE